MIERGRGLRARVRVFAVITDEHIVAQILPALGLPADAPVTARARDPTALVDFLPDDVATPA